MAASSLNPTTQRKSVTRCTHCQTVFEVSEELLQASDTRVRCGECLRIFDAAEALIRDGAPSDGANASRPNTRSEGVVAARAASSADIEAAALSNLINDTASLDVTYSDFDLFSEDAELPELPAFEDTRNSPDLNFDAVESIHDHTFSDTLYQDMLALGEDVTLEPVSEVRAGESLLPTGVLDATRPEIDYTRRKAPETPLQQDLDELELTGAGRDRDRPQVDSRDASSVSAATQQTVLSVSETAAGDAEPARQATISVNDDSVGFFGWLWRVLMVLLLLSLAYGLYAYRVRDRLHDDPLTRPALIAWCQISGCQVPARVDLDALAVLRRNVFSHPEETGALVIDVAIRNEATFAQRYPILHVQLEDQTGEVVARRDFVPREYRSGWTALDTLTPGERLDISLEVSDPGNKAYSFSLKFRELPVSVE